MPSILIYYDKGGNVLSKHNFESWDESVIVAKNCKIETVAHVSVHDKAEWPTHHIEGARKPNGYIDWMKVPNQL